MSKRDFLQFDDLQARTIEQLIQRAIELGELFSARTIPTSLLGARIGLLTELPGWRNPAAFNLGVSMMGAHSVPVAAAFEGPEDVEDLAGYLGNWFDIVAIRTPSLERLSRFASLTPCSVMNLRTHDNHPFEVLGDLSFVARTKGSIDGMRVAVVGADGNIVRSWMEAANVLPIQVLQIAPATLAIDTASLNDKVQTSEDISRVKDVDVIVTDCWPSGVSWHQRAALMDQQIDGSLLDCCSPDVLFIPCPPVSRGQEVSADAMKHPRCVATEAKNYLMHAQNAFAEYAWAGSVGGVC